MSRQSPELFSRDLKFLVDANPPHKRRRSGAHSHFLATGLITVLVGVWLGSDPSASIDVDSTRGNEHVRSAALGPIPEIGLPIPAALVVNRAPEVSEQPPVALEQSKFEQAHDLPVVAGLEFGPHKDRPAKADPEPADAAPALPDELFEAPESRVAAEPALFVPPSLELATGFEEQQSDIETFPLATEFDLTAMNNKGGSGWNVVDIKKGDTLSGIFRGLGIDRDITHKLTTDQNGKLLNSLQTGPNLKIRLNQDGRLEALRYNIDAVRILAATLDEGGIHTDIEKRKISVREREVTGRITSSLFQAGAKAGLSDQFVLRLAAIFKWNIDFTRDLQPGDRFSVIFEEKFIEDRKIATGGIIAAAFVVGGKKHTAVRHVDSDGSISYFSADGASLKRAFLRSPVKFSRISSQFSLSRYHPILKKWRAHKGVDYAAGRGTPVLATADGVVELAGRNGGYGKAVILKHGKSYSTLYGHLDGFAKNVRTGGKVKQGQVIGYVGSSGLATGPHLHYEFRVGGVHKNPLTVDVPRALPIAGAERDSFLKVAGDFDRRLSSLLN